VSERTELRDLLEAFEGVTKQDHPNPDRVGCPNRSRLVTLAGAPANGSSVDRSILSHLTRCWPCLNELKAIRAKGNRPQKKRVRPK
jgi:hypothetical protein